MADVELIRRLYVRVCRDSGYNMDKINAAILVARVIGCHPLEIWIAMPDLWTMEEVARGRHAACENPRYR